MYLFMGDTVSKNKHNTIKIRNIMCKDKCEQL